MQIPSFPFALQGLLSHPCSTQQSHCSVAVEPMHLLPECSYPTGTMSPGAKRDLYCKNLTFRNVG